MNMFNRPFFIFALSFFSAFSLSAAVKVDEAFMREYFTALNNLEVEKVKELVNSVANQVLDQEIKLNFFETDVAFKWTHNSFLHYEYTKQDNSCKSCLDQALWYYDATDDPEKKKKALELFTYFLSKKVNPDQQDHDEDTPLIQILQYSNIDEEEALVLIKLLFEHKSDLNVSFKNRDEDNAPYDALSWAAYKNYKEVVRFLRSKGATIDPAIINVGKILVAGNGELYTALTEKRAQDKNTFSLLDAADQHKYHILGILGVGAALFIIPRLYKAWKQMNQKKRKTATMKKKEVSEELIDKDASSAKEVSTDNAAWA